MKRSTCWIAGLLLTPGLVFADFSYKETTTMTGGALAQAARALGGLSKRMKKVGEPVTSAVYLSGNKMAHVNDASADIWDLDAETMTHVDFEKRTYSTITFAQMKEAMERAMEQAKGKQEKQQRNTADPQADVNFKIDVKETGKTQTIEGMRAREVVLSMIIEAKDKKSNQSGEMQTMTALWMTDKVAGYEEITAFHQRMAEKMASAWSGTAMSRMAMGAAMDPRFQSSAAQMAKEAEKMKGIQLKSITKMGSNLDIATASQVTDPSTMQDGPTKGDVAKSGAESAIGSVKLPGGLGSLGGFGRRRKQQEEPAQDKQAASQQQQGSGVLMEMVMESKEFSTASVDAGKFQAPAGFQQVEHPMLKMGNR